jgi:tetratricopeptide (TPR) repeat protein
VSFSLKVMNVEAQRVDVKTLVERARDLGESGDYTAALAGLEDVVARFGQTGDDVVRRSVAIALWEQARFWRMHGMPERRIATLEELSERFGSATDPYIANFVTRAVYFRALDRYEARDLNPAEALFDESLARARGATDLRVRDAAISATTCKALLMSWRGQYEEAVALLDKCLEDIADLVATRPDFLSFVLVTKLDILDRAGEDVAAVGVADEIIDRFAEGSDRTQRVRVAFALVEKVHSFARLERDESDAEAVLELLVGGFGEEAIEVLDVRIANVDTQGDPDWQSKVAPFLLLRGIVLHELGRLDDSSNAFNDVIERFGDTTHPGVAATVETARMALDDWQPGT